MDTITNLAWSTVKKNKSRSILITISILLTTLLLTTIFTLGYGLIKFQHINAEALYGSYYGTYNNVTDENIRQMKLRSEFTDIGRLAVLGIIESDKSLFLNYTDEKVIRMTNLEKKLVEGSYPASGNEIAAQPAFFRILGINNPKVGDSVKISWWHIYLKNIICKRYQQKTEFIVHIYTIIYSDSKCEEGIFSGAYTRLN